MQYKRLLFKTLLTLAILVLPPFWLISTNSGLKTALKAASLFIPGRLSYTEVNGNLLANEIVLKNLEYAENGHMLQISQAITSWKHGTMILKTVSGFEQFLPGQQLFSISQNSAIDLIDAKLSWGKNTKRIAIRLTGKWQQAPLAANINATFINDHWLLGQSELQVGNNSLIIQPTSATDYRWQLNLPQPELIFINSHGALHAHGEFSDLANPNNFTMHLACKNFRFAHYAVKNLQAEIKATRKISEPLLINITADQLTADANTISKLKINSNGTLAEHTLSGNALLNNNSINIQALATIQLDVWSTTNLTIIYDKQQLHGDAKINLSTLQSQLNLYGSPYNYKTEFSLAVAANKDLAAKLNLHANEQNKLTASIHLQQNKLDGIVNVAARDLSMLMKFIPDVTRLKGILNAEGKIYGTLKDPQISLQAHLTDITATLPALGVKIKPMELHVHNEGHDKLILNGHGKMRRGPGEFKISGYIEPFKANFPHAILLIANELEFIKNDSAQLVANTQLNFNFDHTQQQLNIKGHIDILRGNIFFDPKKPNTVKSKDVVFVDQKATATKAAFRVQPDLSIWIYEGVHFSGFGLDADITGNLDIMQRHDTLYGKGRVTIKTGTFKLPGQTLKINKGRLLYPPGTLLVNPSLDIKMHGAAPKMSSNNTHDANELEIFVRGTAQAPVISETDLANNKDKVLSQIMLTSSSLLSNNALQDKLKLTELGLQSKNSEMPDFFYNPSKQNSSLRDKDLVVGRPIGTRLYMQYLHSMNEKNNRVRLKYALNDIWSLGIEGGEQGAGAELSFVVETD